MADEIADKGGCHAELRIGLEVRIVARIDLRGQRLVPLLEDQEVEVRRSVGVAVLRAKQSVGIG